MALTTEQVLLLNNLMYMKSDEGSPLQEADYFEGQTVGEWINSIDISRLKDTDSYGSFMTGKDWKNIIQAVQKDDTIMDMLIVSTHTDTAPNGGGGGRSAVFVSDTTGDAVVAFKGTEGSSEWKDNFIGGNTSDTPQQENSLEWYQDIYQKYDLDNYEITVTGHSKGGNKAKYITVRDDTVDHCVSFDGQGFSDEFINKYAKDIGDRQYKIENHNIDYDYVNILLNDIGESTYYKGYDYGAGGFLENHCTNTFMHFNEDGSFTLTVNPDGQAKEVKAIDEFLNNYLRSMPEDKQDDALRMVNTILDYAFSFTDNGKEVKAEEIANIYLQMAADPQYADDLAYLLAYTIKYEQANPEFLKEIEGILTEFGMGEFVQYVNIADEILDFKYDTIFGTFDFNKLVGVVDFLSGVIPDWVLDLVSKWLKSKYGIELTKEQLTNLLGIFGMVYDDMNKIKVEDNGKDIRINTVGSPSDRNRTQINIKTMNEIALDFQGVAQMLNQYGIKIEETGNSLGDFLSNALRVRDSLFIVNKNIDHLKNSVNTISNVLIDIANMYEKTEISIFNAIGRM